MTEVTRNESCEKTGKDENVRLSKRLAYLLRYGAEKEGLTVHEGGYVNLFELLRVPMLRWYDAEKVLQEIDKSTSFRQTKRFEKKNENGSIYIRAIYGRRMERNPLHEDSAVPRLLESCMSLILANLDDYDLEEFPDEFLINSMIHKLRRQKCLNNKTLRVLLGPVMEHLDLEGVYLTETTIKLIGQKCPSIRWINLRLCGYVLTDHLMEILLKRIPRVESLNISRCHHLTDRTLRSVVKNCKNLQHFYCSGIPGFSQEGLLNLVTHSNNLKHLDVFYNPNITREYGETLLEMSHQRGFSVVWQGDKSNSAEETGQDLAGRGGPHNLPGT